MRNWLLALGSRPLALGGCRHTLRRGLLNFWNWLMHLGSVLGKSLLADRRLLLALGGCPLQLSGLESLLLDLESLLLGLGVLLLALGS